MYDGRYTVRSVEDEKAILEYEATLPTITIPAVYKFQHGTIALDPGDTVHLYPTDQKVVIVMAPGFITEFITFELDLKTGEVVEIPDTNPSSETNG